VGEIILCVFAPLRENHGVMENPVQVIVFGAILLLVGMALKKQKDPMGNPFLVTGLAVLLLTIFLQTLVHLF
jgi:hypothetical protein